VARGSPVAILAGAGFVIAFGVFFYLVLEGRKEEKPPEPDSAQAPVIPPIDIDPALNSGTQHLTFSGWTFVPAKPPEKRPQKISGLLRFETSDAGLTLQGGLLGDVKYTVFSPSGQKLKVEDFRFGRLSSGETASVEMSFADWSKAARVLIGPRLRPPSTPEK
jgi:hypothetical protein